MKKKTRNADDLRGLIGKGCELRINEWAIEAGLDPKQFRRDLENRVWLDEYLRGFRLEEARARDDLELVLSMLPRYPPVVIFKIPEGGLDGFPATPPTPAVQRMRKIVAAIRERAADALSDDPPDNADLAGDDEPSEEIETNFRRRIIHLFGEEIPGLTGRPEDGQLAVLSLLFSPSHGCYGMREEFTGWSGVYKLERRAISIARKRDAAETGIET